MGLDQFGLELQINMNATLQKLLIFACVVILLVLIPLLPILFLSGHEELPGHTSTTRVTSTQSSTASTTTLPPPTASLATASTTEAPVKDARLVMIAGGTAGAGVEILNLDSNNNNNLSCSPVSDLPYDILGAVGIFLGGQTMICGGQNKQGEVHKVWAKCHAYQPDSNTWMAAPTMLEARFGAASVLVSPTDWWVSGGHGRGLLGDYLDSTELLHANGSFYPNVTLPIRMAYHLAVRLNGSAIVLLVNWLAQKSAYLFDTQKMSFTEWPGSNLDHTGGVAGMVRAANGSQYVVVAGGVATHRAEALNVATKEWAPVASLPITSLELYRASAVQLEDEQTFVIMGGGVGRALDHFTDLVFKFNPVSFAWDKMPQKLGRPNADHVSVLVPPGYLKCEDKLP